MACPALASHDAWRIVRAYLDTYGLVRHQTEAFDNFMLITLPLINI